MNYSKMSCAIPPSPIRDMMVRAAAMPDAISFAVGQPDFKPDPQVVQAAREALDMEDASQYAPGAGITELRQVYADYLNGEIGMHYGVDNVVITTGGMSGLFLALMAMLDPEDEVLISAPYFTNYSQMARMCYGRAVPVDVKEEDGFELTAEAVRRALTPRSKVLMLNTPCNPTGGVISEKTLRELAALAVEKDLLVISDEVYRHILFDGETYTSIATLPGMEERTLIVDSCSKTFAMTGYRVGFCTGPKELIALIIKLTEGIYSSTVTVTQRAAICALKTSMPHCRAMVAEYQKRRDYICGRLNAMKGIRCVVPKGAFYVFVNVSGTGLSAVEFSNRLLEAGHVAVVPGDNFGSSDGSFFVRMSYAMSMEKIAEGCDRMAAFCESL